MWRFITIIWSFLYGYCWTNNFFCLSSFDPNPTTRHTFWGLSVGFCFGGLAFYGASQFTFQRFSAVKTLKQAKL